MMSGRLSSPWFHTETRVGLASVLVTVYGVGIVALLASGRLSLPDACLLLALPAMLAVALLRPEWIVLLVVLLPPTSFVPVRAMALLMVVGLFGFLLQGGVRLGPATGVLPLLGIIALAIAFKTATSGEEAGAAADSMLNLLVYYMLLVLVAFHAVVNGKLRIDTFLNAFLLGLVIAAVIQPFIAESMSLQHITDTPFRGQFAYLSVMGFGVAYVRYSLSRSVGRPQPPLDLVFIVVFAFLTVIGFSRAAWMAALVIFALVSVWTGRRAFWLTGCLLVLLALTVPVVGEQIRSGRSADVGNSETLTEVTTGRNVLWGDLWDRGVDALPFGNGWGYMWSLTSTDVFGFENVFVTQESAFIFAHNDFLYLFVELGVLGLGLLVILWFHLFRTTRALSRSPSASTRYRVRVLMPIIVVMFIVQLFDNGFAIRFVAERFFIAAGLVFGIHFAERAARRSIETGSGFLDTSQGSAVLGE
jgi:O-antigen ligase